MANSSFEINGSIIANSGSFIVGPGSADSPSFEFINDVDTGMFSPAANTIGLATSGVERLRISSVGNVGIGTATPSFTLDINGDIGDSTNGAINVQGLIISNGGGTTSLTVAPGETIGITADQIDINGPLNVYGNLTFDSFTESVVANENSGTSKTLSLASGTVHTCTLTGNCTFTMPTATAGKSFTLFLNSGAGNYTATFTGVRWADSASPTATITASKVDIYSFISDGTYWYGSFSQNYG